MQLRKARNEYEQTGNSSVYRKARKQLYAGCVFCPWHGGENKRRQQKPDRHKNYRR